MFDGISHKYREENFPGFTFPNNDKCYLETPQLNMSENYKILEIICCPDFRHYLFIV
jgi:hypothetical protein